MATNKKHLPFRSVLRIWQMLLCFLYGLGRVFKLRFAYPCFGGLSLRASGFL